MQKKQSSNHYRAAFNPTIFYKIDYKSNVNYLTKIEKPKEYTISTKSPFIYFEPKGNFEHKTAFWKIHISASYQNRIEVLLRTIKICSKNKVAFKILENDSTFIYFNSKEVSRVSSGKFITIYPISEIQFLSLLDELDNILRGFEGQYILTDRRYNKSKCVYYRYGEHYPIAKMNDFGMIDHFYLDGNGLLQKDIRRPFYQKPLDAKILIDEEIQNDESLLLNKYTPVNALHFSSQGGVYLMKDITNKEVVVKEARYLSGLDYQIKYAKERLENEFNFLKKLSSSGIVPKPIEFINDNQNSYLIEEYLKSYISLKEFIYKFNPFINSKLSEKDILEYFSLTSEIIDRIEEIFELLLIEGVFIGDISYNNLLVDLTTMNIKCIDLEFASSNMEDINLNACTPGFKLPPENMSLKKIFNQYLVKIILSLIFPNTMLIDFFPENQNKLCNFYLNNFSEYNCVIKLINRAINLMGDDYNYISEEYQIKDLFIMCKKTFLKNFVENPSAREPFFPSDPHIYNTNKYSLSHGIMGVLYVLNIIYKDDVSIQDLIRRGIKTVKENLVLSQNIPSGLWMGYSGISWAFLELGETDFAQWLFNNRVSKGEVPEDNGLFYGKSGVLLTTLKFYLTTSDLKYKKFADQLFEMINKRSQKEYMNYGEGEAGISLAQLYYYLVTNDEKDLKIAKNSFEIVLNNLDKREKGIGIKREGITSERKVYSPYIYDGISGVGEVALRFYLVTQEEKYYKVLQEVIKSLEFPFTLFPTYMRGMAGIISFLTDCEFYLKDDFLLLKCNKIKNKLIENLKCYTHVLDKDLYFFGEQLFKCSLDYSSGSAGILFQLSRLFNKDKQFYNDNFFLDELIIKRRDFFDEVY